MIQSRICLFLLLCLPTFAVAQAGGVGVTTTPPSAPLAASPVASNDLCLTCHSDAGDKLKTHVHATVACQSCHLKHEDYPHPEGVPKPQCSTCHANMASDYAHSAHGMATRAGNKAAPDCATCHGKAHEIENTKTSQFRAGVPDLCGACHIDVLGEYSDSVHGQAVKHGVIQSPVCTDCHGEHSILPAKNAASTVNPNHVRDTCANCHNSVRLMRRFGLPSDRIVSFDSSFHGLASKSGTETVANCSSCHGVHNIRASSDPASMIHPSHLAATCGKCHQGAGSRFALGPIHTSAGPTEAAAVRWIRWIYWAIIPLTIGLMFLHNFGDWLRKLKRLRFAKVAVADQTSQHEPALRTLPFERIEHACLAISFIVLAWTGFALKYPDHWWARPALLSETSHSMRGIIHRVASVVFMSAALAHVLSLIVSKPLRDHWLCLWPKVRDLREAVSNFVYNVGFGDKAPVRSPHSYVEKAEYWALVWGTIVMVLSGVLLWGNNIIMRWMPKVVLDIATSVHFYEAVLATLAIVVWHFYFVVFDPDVYPMDTAWLTGKSPRKE
jgi:cytochrome b subunit of formate dehydrogenase